jgi:mannose-6-phosphate isomerase-like protein (cupin superfamily)
MQIYHQQHSHLFCGHWNGSPVEIGVTSVLKQIPGTEVYHYHDYHEYYVVLEGRAELVVEAQTVPLTAGTVVMVHPGEKHRVSWVDPEVGVRWVIIKQHSVPNSKHCVPEDDQR